MEGGYHLAKTICMCISEQAVGVASQWVDGFGTENGLEFVFDGGDGYWDFEFVIDIVSATLERVQCYLLD